MELIFATNNANKIFEARHIIKNSFTLITLQDAGIEIDIPEPHNTLEENATEKSSVIYKLTGKDCFSEDTGLEVDILNGEPGVLSARYAGENKSATKNIEKLLFKLKDKENREAKFRTVLSLIVKGKEYMFEGICRGTIITNPTGMSGFGYDAVFKPSGSNKTLAEMDINEKNKFSHRRHALEKMIGFLNFSLKK